MGRMTPTGARSSIPRRTLLKAGLAWTAGAMAAPFPIRARAETPVKIGMVEPLTGVYADARRSPKSPARGFAVERGQPRAAASLAGQSSCWSPIPPTTSPPASHKTRELIERDQVDFITGNVNSAVALAMTQVTAEKRKLHIVTGGHIDEITGGRCSWNVFRICKTTTMEANAIADTLIEKFGKRWYFLTPDYVYGHALQAAFERKLHQHGGKWAASMLAARHRRLFARAERCRQLSAAGPRSISWAATIKRTACGRSCASASTTTWPSAARCSSSRAS